MDMAMQSLRAMSFFVIWLDHIINAEKPVIWLNFFNYLTTLTTYK